VHAGSADSWRQQPCRKTLSKRAASCLAASQHPKLAKKTALHGLSRTASPAHNASAINTFVLRVRGRRLPSLYFLPETKSQILPPSKIWLFAEAPFISFDCDFKWLLIKLKK